MTILSCIEAEGLAAEFAPHIEFDLLLLAADLAAQGVDDFLLHCLSNGAYDLEDVMELADFVPVVGTAGVDTRVAKDLVRTLMARDAAQAAALEATDSSEDFNLYVRTNAA